MNGMEWADIECHARCRAGLQAPPTRGLKTPRYAFQGSTPEDQARMITAVWVCPTPAGPQLRSAC